MADMLSVPQYSSSLSASYSSSKDSTICCRLIFGSRSRIHSTIAQLFFVSQMPSHPIMMNSTPFLSILWMSGVELIICSAAFSCRLFLNSMSPIDRDKFRLWFTLPPDTNPPAFLIRFISFLSCGWWSKLRGTGLPLTQATQRESPAFATITSSSVRKQTLAVHPANSFSLLCLLLFPSATNLAMISLSSFLPMSVCMMKSILLNVSTNAQSYFRSLNFLFRYNSSEKCFCTYCATSAPPWPSKTPNKQCPF